MRTLFVIAILMTSLSTHAWTSEAFRVSTYTTVENNDIENELYSRAVSRCGGATARRISPVQTNYKNYMYNITAWAHYVCID